VDTGLALRRSALVSAARGLLLPFPDDRRLPRIGQLYVGLVVYGVSTSLLVLGRHGLVPWDVLHQGLARHTGLAIGTWSILISVAVLVFWVPLHEKPGIGTISNAIVIGGTMDIVLGLAPEVHDSVARWSCSLGGVLLNGVATGMYIGAGLGPGPRDGLMTGLARISGRSLRLVRAGLEATVLALGWLLGGSVGVGTVVYLVAIGPLAHAFVPVFSRRRGG
jgi:uncharacterized membrane protein YczE